MLLASVWLDGPDRLVLIGLAHSAAYALGAGLLAVRLRGDAGMAWRATQLRPTVLAISAGALAWLAMDAWSPEGRGPTLGALVVLGGGALGAYAAGLWAAGGLPARGPATIGSAR
jgi:hypothetical protein